MTTAISHSKPTFATLLALVEESRDLTSARRREIASGIRTCAKVLRREPHLIPATPDLLRPLLLKALPAAVGVSGRRFANAKSLLRQALQMLNPDYLPARSRDGLSPAWSALLSQPEAKPLRRGLARLSKWCSAAGIEPEAVDQVVYERFGEDLSANGLMRDPKETLQSAGRTWNTAHSRLCSWPASPLTVPNYQKNRSLPLEAFPASFQQDVAAYMAPRSDDVLRLVENRPTLRPATIERHRLTIRQIATALVEAGRDISTIRTIADLVKVENAQAALRVFVARAGTGKNRRNACLAYTMLGIAKHWVRADDATLKALKAFGKNLQPRQSGMTTKNRLRLTQFRDWTRLNSLLSLPEILMAEACGVPQPGPAEARIAQLAVAIEILTMAPIRIKNLCELEIGRTLILDGSKVAHIIIDGSEVKNEFDLEIPLPETARRLIDRYLSCFHAKLAPPGCAMLFPSADGGHKRSTVLGTQITRCLAARCGIEMNPHLFRHLAAFIYLKAHPGAYGVIRLLLGHKNFEATIKAYCSAESEAAHLQYDAYIEKLRGSLAGPTDAMRQVVPQVILRAAPRAATTGRVRVGR